MPSRSEPNPARIEELLEVLKVPPGKRINLTKDYDPGFTGKWMGEDEAKATLAEGIQMLAEMQDKLYAQGTYGLLVVLQALDAAGKDGTIKHVMSGVNPQGVDVHSFKAPAGEELDHDYLWRNFVALPRRGHIGIFNRSYYEEVLVVRVHPEFLAGQKLPAVLKDPDIWNRRFDEINHFEKYLVNNGIPVVKIFLYVSRDAQRERFLERTQVPEKNWKFSAADMKERQRWPDYIAAYEDIFNHTSTEWAPWYIVPADHKWFSRLAVAAVIYHTLDCLNLAYPTVGPEQRQSLLVAQVQLETDDGAVTDASIKRTALKKRDKSKHEGQASKNGHKHAREDKKAARQAKELSKHKSK